MRRTLATAVGVVVTLALGTGLTFGSILVGLGLMGGVMLLSKSSFRDSNTVGFLGTVVLLTLAATFPCLLAASIGGRVATRLGAPPDPVPRSTGFLRGVVAYVVGVVAGVAVLFSSGYAHVFEIQLPVLLASPVVGLLATRAVLRTPHTGPSSPVDATVSVPTT